MDKDVRAQIYHMLHHAYDKQKVLDTVEWAIEADENIESPEDFALGYLVGALANLANGLVVEKKVTNWRLGEAEKAVTREEFEKIKVVNPKAKYKLKKVDTTDKEVNDIREMIIPMVPQFRAKISQEIALKNR